MPRTTVLKMVVLELRLLIYLFIYLFIMDDSENSQCPGLLAPTPLHLFITICFLISLLSLSLPIAYRPVLHVCFSLRVLSPRVVTLAFHGSQWL